MLIAAVLAWGISGYSGSLATWIGVTTVSANVVVTTHALPGRKFGVGLAVWADEAVEELACILFADVKARAMIPIVTTSLAVHHHAVIIRATADTVFAAVIALRVGTCCSSRAWGLAGTIGGRSSTGS